MPRLNGRWERCRYWMEMMQRTMIATLLGVAVGISGQYYLFIGIYSLIPWGLCGIGLGYLTRGKVEAAISGALYGFALAFSFMVWGYSGTSPIWGRLPFFGLLGIFGAACGLSAAMVGRLIRTRVADTVSS